MIDVPLPSAAELLSFEQVASICGISQRTLHRLMRTAAFPKPVRFGVGPRGTVRFRRKDIESWIENGCPRE